MPVDDLPEDGELVVATVHKVKNFGAFVSLDEYAGREGFIHITEVATGWVKYIRDHIREGQKLVCKVIRVDPRKGQIDLSLKHVNEHQKREKIQAWKDEQKASKLLEIVLERVKMSEDKWYARFGNALLEECGSLYGVFERSIEEESFLKKRWPKEKWVKEFISIARENIVPSKVSVEGTLMVTSNAGDGIVRIRNALAPAERVPGATLTYLSAPCYRLVVTGKEYKSAEENLRRAAEMVVDAITRAGGKGEFVRAKK